MRKRTNKPRISTERRKRKKENSRTCREWGAANKRKGFKTRESANDEAGKRAPSRKRNKTNESYGATEIERVPSSKTSARNKSNGTTFH